MVKHQAKIALGKRNVINKR